MPCCLKCGTCFPNRAIIDGRRRNLSSRKYCLECSPFGSGNTQRIHEQGKSTLPCTCQSCGREYEYQRSKCCTQTRCSSCITKARRLRVKKRAVAYLGGACTRCGYDKCLGALDFHHIHPGEKDFTISRAYCRAWKVVQEELDKCELLCKNCHYEFHEMEL